jgi:hypothetical protein
MERITNQWGFNDPRAMAYKMVGSKYREHESASSTALPHSKVFSRLPEAEPGVSACDPPVTEVGERESDLSQNLPLPESSVI